MAKTCWVDCARIAVLRRNDYFLVKSILIPTYKYNLFCVLR